MPRELVTVQVGQCGNQLGTRFWELALREHCHYNTKGRYDEALSSFFRNVDTRQDPPEELRVKDGTGPIRTLRARAVLVDMEEGVINETLRGPLGDNFDSRMHLTDISGSGNNWAHGYHVYGPQYCQDLMDRVRATVEDCDSVQGFFLLHSIGGGTGSGFGTFLLEQLADHYPEVYRFATSVFPSENDDVVTSPYNSMFSFNKLTEFADCVLPVENQALQDICARIDDRKKKSPVKSRSTIDGPSKNAKPYDKMNGIAANMLLNLTSSVRFAGQLNVDLNEITTNLVPFPRMHYLVASMAPLAATKDVGRMAGGRTPAAIDKIFTEALAPSSQLLGVNPKHSTYLASAFMFRGPVTISDVERNVRRLKAQVKMAHWNTEAFKVGICSVPPVGLPYSCLALSNNCCFGQKLGRMRDRFVKLYRAKAYVNHYEEYGMLPEEFQEALENLDALKAAYEAHDRNVPGTR